MLLKSKFKPICPDCHQVIGHQILAYTDGGKKPVHINCPAKLARKFVALGRTAPVQNHA